MKIVAVDPFILHVPVTGGSIADSTHRITHWGVVGTAVRIDNGLTGWGFTGTHAHLPGDRLITGCIRGVYAPLLLGRDAADHAGLIDALTHHAPTQWIGRAGVTQLALAAVDIALWDLRAKAAGVPLYQLLGGSPEAQVPAYQTDTGWLSIPTAELVRGCRDAVERDGFVGVKVKVGSPDPLHDVRRVEAVREAIGPSAMLAVDGNGKWDLPTAVRFCRHAEPFDLYWFEEPLWYDDIAGHAELASRSRIPIALGEQLYTPDAFAAFLRSDAVHYAQPDVTRLAGVTDFLRVADACACRRTPVAPHVGDMGQVHVHLALHHPACRLLEYIPWIREAFEEPVVVRDGRYQRPQQPGAGTTPTTQAIERYAKP